jgi:hypothetical protein
MKKQVLAAASANSSTVAAASNGTNPQQNNLFISVKTFDPEGRTIGERIVDMYHFGTRTWLQNHHWWAMHNGNCVETNVATQTEVDAYLAKGTAALAEKFNGKSTETISAPQEAEKAAA